MHPLNALSKLVTETLFVNRPPGRLDNAVQPLNAFLKVVTRVLFANNPDGTDTMPEEENTSLVVFSPVIEAKIPSGTLLRFAQLLNNPLMSVTFTALSESVFGNLAELGAAIEQIADGGTCVAAFEQVVAYFLNAGATLENA